MDSHETLILAMRPHARRTARRQVSLLYILHDRETLVVDQFRFTSLKVFCYKP